MMHKINIIIKMVVILIVVLFLFSVSIAMNLGAQNSNNSTKFLSEGALCYDQIPKELTKQIPNRYQHVNPFSLYSKEPAPMGIADYGIGPNGQPFKYRTSKFLGIISVNNLGTYNASLNQSAYSIGFQLNVNLFFENGNTQYAYWVQDVAFVNTSDVMKKVF